MQSSRRRSSPSKRPRTDSLRGPDLDPGGHRWLVRTAHANYWRVCQWMDLDDLIQDGFVCYAKIRAHYPDRHSSITMSLFKAAFINHIHDLSKRRTVQAIEQPFANFSDETIAILTNKEIDSFAELVTEIAEHERPVSIVLKKLLAEAERLRPTYRRRRRRQRETLNQRLCRIAGLDPDGVNVHQMIEEALDR